MSNSISDILRAPNSEVVEKYLQEALGGHSPWLIEKKVISVAAEHFARLMRWPEKFSVFHLQARLAMHDWVAQRKREGEPDHSLLAVDATAELLALALQKMPRDILVPMDDGSD